MASAMTIDGLDELLAGVSAFPEKFDQAAQAVADASARRIETRALAILRSKVRGNPITITVRSEPQNRQTVVEADFAPGQPTEAHLWFEYGTAERAQKSGRRTGQIRPVRYMRDSIATEQTAFPRAIDGALTATIQSLFG